MNHLSWKKLFFGILILNLIVLISVLTLILWPIQEKDFPHISSTDDVDQTEFFIRTTKQNLNELINAYIDQLLKNTNHHYQIILDQDVHLVGEIPVFSATVPLSIRFEPFVLDNGNLILKQKSIYIGRMQLPNRKIMEYVDRHLPMPEWIFVNPKEEEIYVALSEMNIRSNFEIRVEQFNLRDNDLTFKIKIPYKNLWIEQ